MNKAMKLETDAWIYDRVHAVRMTEAERDAALHALRTAHGLVDACTWLKERVMQVGERMWLKPSAQQ